MEKIGLSHIVKQISPLLRPFRIFCVRAEERWVALISFLVFATLNIVQVGTHWNLYSKASHVGFYTVYYKHVDLSGYDSWSCVMLSNGDVYFDTLRHPLYAVLLYPLYLINQWVMDTFHVSIAMPLMALLLLFCAVWGAVFFFRLLHSVMGLRTGESGMLTLMLFGFAHVMVAGVAPDHFFISLFLLLLTLLVMGQALKAHVSLRPWQTGTLFFLTSGLSLTNGLKVLLGSWWIERRRFFQPRRLLVSVVLPLVLLAGLSGLTYVSVVKPSREKIAQRDKVRVSKLKKRNDTKFFKENKKHNEWKKKNGGKKLGEGDISQYMDVSSSRWKSIWHNFFGESLQLHRDYLLHDMLMDRPMIVHYRSVVNYVVEALLLLLFFLGIVTGWRSRLMQLLLWWFAVDVGMHLVLGFALDEVYIMTSGWAFIIPVAMGHLLLRLKGRWRDGVGLLVSCLAVFLFCYNSSLLLHYLLNVRT